MSKILILCLGLTFGLLEELKAQESAESEIKALLDRQTSCWNKGKLECFMEGYWESDSLMFIGKSGITYGWQKTLENYKKGYPDLTTMGKLSFDLISLEPLEDHHYFVVGKWHLKREIGDIGGHFTLLFKKIKDEWVIIADHSS